MLFLSKFTGLVPTLIKGMLRYWPHGNSSKEQNFLTLLSEVLEIGVTSLEEELLRKVIAKIGKCIQSDHLQISDRAMCFLENAYIVKNIKE